MDCILFFLSSADDARINAAPKEVRVADLISANEQIRASRQV